MNDRVRACLTLYIRLASLRGHRERFWVTLPSSKSQEFPRVTLAHRKRKKEGSSLTQVEVARYENGSSTRDTTTLTGSHFSKVSEKGQRKLRHICNRVSNRHCQFCEKCRVLINMGVWAGQNSHCKVGLPSLSSWPLILCPASLVFQETPKRLQLLINGWRTPKGYGYLIKK